MDTTVTVYPGADFPHRATLPFVLRCALALMLFALSGCTMQKIKENLVDMTRSASTNEIAVSAAVTPPPEPPVKVAADQSVPPPAPAPAPAPESAQPVASPSHRAVVSRPPSSVVKGAEQLAAPNPQPARPVVHEVEPSARPAVVAYPEPRSSHDTTTTVSGSISEGLVFTGPPRKFRSPSSHRVLWVVFALVLAGGAGGFVIWYGKRGENHGPVIAAPKDELKLPRELRSKDPIGFVSDSTQDPQGFMGEKGYNPAAPG